MIKRRGILRMFTKNEMTMRGICETLVRNLSTIVLGVLLLLALSLKFAVARQHSLVILDVSNYLVTMHKVFGHDFTGQGPYRPPLIAIPIRLASAIWGPLDGPTAVGLVIAVLIGLPFYLLARRISQPAIASLVAGVFIFSIRYSYMLAWGYITFFGIFFSLLTFYFVLKVLRNPSRGNTFFAGLSASLVAGFHQVSFLIFLFIMAIFLLLLVFEFRDLRRTLLSLLAVGLVGAALAIPYIPAYLSQAHQFSGGYSAFRPQPFQQVHEIVNYLWGRSVLPLPPALLVLVSIAGSLTLWRQDKKTFLLLCSTLLAVLFLTVFDMGRALTYRSHYLGYAPIWLLFAAGTTRIYDIGKAGPSWLQRTMLRPLLLASLLLLFGVQARDSQECLARGIRYYHTLGRTEVEAIAWIAEHVPSDANIAVYPRTFGRWIEGLAARNAFEVVGPAGEIWEEQTRQALVAVMIFSGNQAIENGNLRWATTYPYLNPGPVLGVKSGMPGAGPTYLDVLQVVDDLASVGYVGAGGSGETSLSAADTISLRVLQNAEAIQMVTTFRFSGFDVVRTLTLHRGEREASLRYHFPPGEGQVTRFRLPLAFVMTQPEINEEGDEVTALQRRKLGTFQTTISLDTSRAHWQVYDRTGDGEGLIYQFEPLEPSSSIEFDFDLVVDYEIIDAPLNYFVVPDLLRENNIQYIALDKTPPFIKDEGLPSYVLQWLDEAPYYVPLYDKDDIKIYEVVLDYPHRPQTTVTAYLEGGINFLGWSTLRDLHRPGEPLNLFLYWRAQGHIDEDYKVFAHLLNEQGEIVTQHDSQPCLWRCPTSACTAGDTVIDLHPVLVSGDVEAGEYTLAVGMYYEPTGERVAAYDDQGRRLPHDMIILGKVSLEK